MKTLMTLNGIILRRDEFTLQIDRLELLSGQVYILQGPNGAGKSTLLHVMALLLTPHQGEISFQGIDGNNAQKRARLRQQITLVEQQPFLFNTSVYDNLAFGLRLRDVRGELQRRRISQALQAVDLEDFAERRAQELSGGETRRVALARAMILRPQLLLLDEPTAGLDRDVVPTFERCLTALAAQGTTVVIAGHDADQHQRLGGELLCLERGRLISTSTHELSSQHKELA